MVTKEVACVRCRKVVSWHFVLGEDNYCDDCARFFQVLAQAKTLTPEQQAELIAALQKGE